jgi:hypothetical protein
MMWMTNTSLQRSGRTKGRAIQFVAATLLAIAWLVPSANARSDEVITTSSGA